MKQIFTLSSSGIKRVVPSYFAEIGSNSVLGANWQPVNPRANSVLVFKKHRKTVLESGDFLHLLKSAADFVSSTYSTDRRTISVPSPLLIDGIAVVTGDRIEMSSAIATALNVSPGTWIAGSDRQISLEKAPVYNLSSAWDCGAPWAYRTDTATNELVGLAPISFTITDTWNKNPSGQIKNPTRIFDTDLWTIGDHALISWGGYRITFNAVTIRRMAIYTKSIKVPGESYKPSRFRVAVPAPAAENLNRLFYNLDTGVQANSDTYTFALASTETWCTKEMNKTVSGLSFDDDDGSRGYTSICSYGDLPCQITIKNIKPPTGSEVLISEAVASGFFPAIQAGTYVLTENGASGSQWRMRKQ